MEFRCLVNLDETVCFSTRSSSGSLSVNTMDGWRWQIVNCRWKLDRNPSLFAFSLWSLRFSLFLLLSLFCGCTPTSKFETFWDVLSKCAWGQQGYIALIWVWHMCKWSKTAVHSWRWDVLVRDRNLFKMESSLTNWGVLDAGDERLASLWTNLPRTWKPQILQSLQSGATLRRHIFIPLAQSLQNWKQGGNTQGATPPWPCVPSASHPAGPKSDQQWFGNFRVVLSDDTPVMEAKFGTGQPSRFTQNRQNPFQQPSRNCFGTLEKHRNPKASYQEFYHLSHFVACSPLLPRSNGSVVFPSPSWSWPWNRWTSKDRPRTTAELRPLAIDQMNFDEFWWILMNLDAFWWILMNFVYKAVQNVAPNPPGPASSCNMALSRRCSSRRMDSMDVFLGHWANLGHLAMPCLCLELAPWNQVVYIMSKRGKNTFTWMGMGQTPWLYMGGSGKSNRFEFRFMWSHGRFDLLRTGMDNEMETLSSDI